MADFFKAFRLVNVNIEGGYSDDPDDYGGETNLGFAKRYHPNLDVKNLKYGDALMVGKKEYWDKLNLDQVNSQDVANEAYDAAIHCGWPDAAKWMQEGCNLLDYIPGSALEEDGLIGPKSLQAINSLKHQRALAIFINGCHFQHLREIRNEKYLNGWLLKRIERRNDLGGYCA